MHSTTHRDSDPIGFPGPTIGYDGSFNSVGKFELVFGFVGPAGIDLGKVCDVLRSQLRSIQYLTEDIQLNDLIAEYTGEDPLYPNFYEREKSLMHLATHLRETCGRADIAARLAIADICRVRTLKAGDAGLPMQHTVYLVSSFKRPEEVEFFRKVYGNAFTLISVYATKAWRTDFLKRAIAASLSKDKASADRYAAELISTDHHEEERPLGQRVGKTFPLADYFVSGESRPALESSLQRLVHLTFGDPYISPTRDEQSMFFAWAAALRSLDLSRQVGAAIVTADGELLSTGCNEVPKFGGGLYWAEDGFVERDVERGIDSNANIKRQIIEDVFARLKARNMLRGDAMASQTTDLAADALFNEGAYLKDSQIFDVIEFGRSVHAEMAAISQASRLGIPLQDSRLFCTTFPCHICARHIVAAGVREVVFIEPYEKSRALELFGDSLSVESAEPSSTRTNLRAFVGVAPRRYSEFFEATASRKTPDGKVLPPDAKAVTPRLKRSALSYTHLEGAAIAALYPAPSNIEMRSP